MDYKSQLKSPKWQKKRLDILNLKNFKCENCGDEDKMLHVHHRFYISGRKVWEYDNDVFQVLCAKCHSDAHKKMDILINDDIYDFIESIINIDSDELLNLSDIVTSGNYKYNKKVFEMISNVISSPYGKLFIDNLILLNETQIYKSVISANNINVTNTYKTHQEIQFFNTTPDF